MLWQGPAAAVRVAVLKDGSTTTHPSLQDLQQAQASVLYVAGQKGGALLVQAQV